MFTNVRNVAHLALLLTIGAGSLGCETKAQTGALVGGAGGAAIGGLIGSTHKSQAGAGALIGAGVGAIGGYIVGNELDKKDQREGATGREDGRYSSEASAPISREQMVSKKDVIRWTNEGVKDEIIIDRVERSGTRFEIRASDENELRDAGVSEEVVRAMKATRVARY
jgi:uncharacterized protein YcfJ